MKLEKQGADDQWRAEWMVRKSVKLLDASAKFGDRAARLHLAAARIEDKITRKRLRECDLQDKRDKKYLRESR
jgi:hypothetical protein